MNTNIYSQKTDKSEKLKRLQLTLGKKGIKSSPKTNILKRNSDAPTRLSFAQQRLWFLDQLESEGAQYNIVTAYLLKGVLNQKALEQSFNEIVKRHEILSTVFVENDGEPFQNIAPFSTIVITTSDLSGLSEPQQQSESRRIIKQEGRKRFRLDKGSLFKVRLIRLGEREQILLLIVHHIVADGWSIKLLYKELSALYEAFDSGNSPALAELPIQYADFAIWQREQYQKQFVEQQLRYWRAQLQGTPTLNLLTDRARQPSQSYRGKKAQFKLSAVLTDKLKALSVRHKTTLFMTLLAAFNVLLSRYSGQTDIAIGTPIANRNRTELEPLIGMFVNTLVLRTDLSGQPSFEELLDRVREVALDAYTHQDLPFDKMVDELSLERDLSRNPLFQVMFAYQNLPEQPLRLAGLDVEHLTVSNETSKFDLTLTIRPIDKYLLCSLEFSSELFDEATIHRMFGHLETLLEGITSDPRQSIRRLPLLSGEERHELLEQWNRTEVAYARDECIHELIEAQVERSPEAVAVVFGDQRLSYRELDSRANRLAHYLISLGVEVGSLVGICVERSAEMMVALLGVLKAGGTYVPLDPEFPRDRLSFMLEDAGLRVLLTQAHLLEQLPARGTTVVCVDADAPRIDGCSAQSPCVEARAEGLAYVIYTSGSTGQPKGVQISHRSVSNFLSSMQREPGVVAKDTLLAVTTLSFDIAVLELFLPLMVGARVVIASREDALDGERLMGLLSGEGVSVMQATPTTWRLLLGAGWRGTPGLKILCGGEALGRDLAKELVGRGASVWNLYGPTETTVWSTCYRVSDAEGPILVGRPIANTRVYVLDLQGQPVPIGVAGELYIGGEGVACGYLNRPQLNAERFVPDSFSGDPAARLYRTGDLVRFRADANLEYLNRVDHQVKLRGFRIELGEIEAALAEHEAVDRAVVELREDAVGDRRLVAYVVASTQHHGSEGGDRNLIPQLRAHLRGKLPAYMVPANFVRLDALPLTPNKKVDRRALPAPDGARPELENKFVPPRTAAERALAELWCDTLAVEQVGVHDNFFDLGGDSLLGLRMTLMAKKAGIQITARDLFQHQTIAELALVIRETARVEAEQGMVTGEFPLSPAMYRFLSERDSPDPHHWNMSALFEPKVPLSPRLLEKVTRSLLSHHDALRLRLSRKNSSWQPHIADNECGLEFSSFDLSDVPEAEQTSKLESISAEIQASLDLTVGPMIRIVHFDLGSSKSQRVLVVVHHFAVDDYSWKIFLDDLERAYLQLTGGQPIELPQKTTSYKHWADYLKEYAHDEALQNELSYWRNLPWEHVKPITPDFHGADNKNDNSSGREVSVTLSSSETAVLLQSLGKAYSPRDVIVTALAKTIANWTASRVALIDVLNHGRDYPFEQVDLSRTMGFFAYYNPMVIETDGNRTAAEALASIAAQIRRIPNDGIGYDILRVINNDDEVRGELSATPRSQILLNYLGKSEPKISQRALLKRANEPRGNPHSPRGKRYYVLSVLGRVTEGLLTIKFVYSNNLHKESTIKKLAQECLVALQEVIKAH